MPLINEIDLEIAKAINYVMICECCNRKEKVRNSNPLWKDSNKAMEYFEKLGWKKSKNDTVICPSCFSKGCKPNKITVFESIADRRIYNGDEKY